MKVSWLCAVLAGLCQGTQLLPVSSHKQGNLQVNSNTTQGLAVCSQKCLEQHPGPLVCTHNAVFNSPITVCVQTTCPFRQDLLAWETRYAEQCGLEARDEGERNIIVISVLFGLSTLFVAGRILSRSRCFEGPGFWWDDWLVLVIWVLSIEVAICAVIYRIHWNGRDVIGFVTLHDIDQVLLWTYISEPVYLIGTYGTKLVWVLLYLRVWESNTMFRKLCWITASFLTLAMVGYPIGAIVTFWPHIFYIGKSAIVRQNFWGIDLIPAVMGLGASIVVHDFWVLLLPIPKLVRLTGVTKQRRAAICAVIMLGFVVTACSIVRLTHILPLRDSRNPNWDFGFFATWSAIELYLSLITCNLPATAGLVNRLMMRRRQNKPIRSANEVEESSTWSRFKSCTTRPSQSGDMESGSTLEAELVEDAHGKIVMRQKQREQSV